MLCENYNEYYELHIKSRILR